ncbi:Pentapeptide repeat-like protein [Glarea lozoyensis ATCC 20868]|uniref:Pentapeptide repeat-like protein n=1 Tax=Glarea lozoyensis (strain ATCC 20868 / MF5171) TaxID=1116229 RepID=S3CG30_GLAL2|nr:Pentapeptide repeat-like protein [Glarea lozoyensis ATCC 20868]EPE24855.1 Pentapeptide repeat-like protein [Glarea lozoyensis ATCC 20868]
MTKWTKRKKTKKPVVIEEPEEPVYLAEYSDTTLRDKLLEDCLVTRCQVYNCTIKRTKFSESEIYECIFADLGDEPATDANAFDECKIYSCNPIRYATMVKCEVNDSTFSSGVPGMLNSVLKKSKFFNCCLLDDPWISWSELHECELSWPSYPPSEIRKAGLYHCKIYTSSLANPVANESRFRNSKLFGLPATEAMPDRTTCRTLDSSTFVECDIRRVGVTHSLFIKCKLKYAANRRSTFARCTVRRPALTPQPANDVEVSRVLANFPQKNSKNQKKPSVGSKMSLEHLPMEIQMRIVHFAAATLEWQGVTPPLIASLRGHQLLYRAALTSFARKNWFIADAQLKAFEAEDDKMSSKAWHSLRKLEILNVWRSNECTSLIEMAPLLTSLDLNLGATIGRDIVGGPSAEILPKVFASVKKLKCLSRLSLIKFRPAYTFQHSKAPYHPGADVRGALASFVQDLEEEWRIKSLSKETEAFHTYTWKAPASCTLN